MVQSEWHADAVRYTSSVRGVKASRLSLISSEPRDQAWLSATGSKFETETAWRKFANYTPHVLECVQTEIPECLV